MRDRIKIVHAREILCGTGKPTVEVEIMTEQGIKVEASVPSGTSRGKYEAFELYDGGKRFRGYGVLRAVNNVNKIITPKLFEMDVRNQNKIDQMMQEIDGSTNKSNLGGNAILAVSLAVAKAGAISTSLPLYRYLGELSANRLPMPLATVLAGGKYSPSPLPFEDYILILKGFSSFSDSLEALTETYHYLSDLVKLRFGSVPEVGGALAIPSVNTEDAFDLMLQAIEKGGYRNKILLGLDVAASELYNVNGNYYQIGSKKLKPDELIDYYRELTQSYPLIYIEDPFEEDSFDYFAKLTQTLPGIQIVGDDLFASNPLRIQKGIETKAANTLLLKINQIGTVTETLKAAKLATSNHQEITVSIRSNDTNDSFIADLAVAVNALQIKVGSPVRGERNAKYNRLLKIEKELGSEARFAGSI